MKLRHPVIPAKGESMRKLHERLPISPKRPFDAAFGLAQDCSFRRENLMKGFQFLENNFFDLCETRKIHRLPMLLYIYLRGLYCRFQKPNFFWYDKTTRKHLGITQTTLASAKSYLQERGLIQYQSGTGRIPTQYTMLGTVLLPELRVLKIKTLGQSSRTYEPLKNYDPLYTSKERLKKKVGIFQGMTERDRDLLRTKGIYG